MHALLLLPIFNSVIDVIFSLQEKKVNLKNGLPTNDVLFSTHDNACMVYSGETDINWMTGLLDFSSLYPTLCGQHDTRQMVSGRYMSEDFYKAVDIHAMLVLEMLVPNRERIHYFG